MADNRTSFLAAVRFILLSSCVCQFVSSSEQEIKLIKNILSNEDNKLGLPPGEKPVSITVDIHITGFPHISELNMEFAIAHDFRMTWKDERLAFDTDTDFQNITSVRLLPVQIERIWKPDIFFPNERGSSMSSPLTDSNSLLKIKPDGSVVFSRRLETVFKCEMMFHDYPFDVQNCSIIISSYGYDTKSVDIRWKKFIPVQVHHNLSPMDFNLTAVKTGTYEQESMNGQFSRVKFSFGLRRHSSFYIIQVCVLKNPLSCFCSLAAFVVQCLTERQF